MKCGYPWINNRLHLWACRPFFMYGILGKSVITMNLGSIQIAVISPTIRYDY